eukprot:jgi/Galph1/2688/GphlegSOOS_G1348.1
MGGDTNKTSRGNFNFSRPRGRGGKGRTVSRQDNSSVKTESGTSRQSSTEKLPLPSDKKLVPLATTADGVNSKKGLQNINPVERELQQRYEKALQAARQSVSGLSTLQTFYSFRLDLYSGVNICKSQTKPWSKGSAPIFSSKDFLEVLDSAEKNFGKTESTSARNK